MPKRRNESSAASPSPRTDMRFALLRDLDTPDLDPWGVLMETPDGGARVFQFGPRDTRFKEFYPGFDQAVSAMHRSWLISFYGREGDHAE